jgi:putative restriction endonuclease
MTTNNKSSRDVPPDVAGTALSRHWWVNYAAGDHAQIDGSYLWLPKSNSNGSRNQSHQNLTRVAPGDMVFACTAGVIGALGFVLDRARSASLPEQSAAAPPTAAARDGWLIAVRFVELALPLRAQPHLAELKPLLPARHSPLRAAGEVNQNVYLAEIPTPMAAVLRRLLQPQVEDCEARIGAETDGKLAQRAIEDHIWRRADIAPQERRQLIGARVGQGVFRERLECLETACRVTGIMDRRYLQATHIKPWKDADDDEKLDGANGLLLSPHMRLLFERGHISFTDEGALLVSRHLNPYVRTAWCVEQRAPARAFTPAQCAYLQHHRWRIFETSSAGRRAVSERAPAQDHGA